MNKFERTINASDLQEWMMCTFPDWCEGDVRLIYDHIDDMPSAQPEPAIPLSWIEGQIEWLKSLDNAFSALTAGQISAMVNKWKDEQKEGE